MAADQRLQLISAAHKTSASPASNEGSGSVMHPAADPAVTAPVHNAGAAGSSFLQSDLRQVQAATSAVADHNSLSLLSGSASKIGRELYLSPISCTSDRDLRSSTHTSPSSQGGCFSNKKLGICVPSDLQVPVAEAVDKELGLAALQDGVLSPIMTTRAHKTCKKQLHFTSREESTQKFVEENVEDAGEVDQEEEEEGCVTPKAKDQRIPHYNAEVNALVCPPAPMKKKACFLKRRRLFYSANIETGAAIAADADTFNYHGTVAERRAFLVDPPDLHNLPDCIRALFK